MGVKRRLVVALVEGGGGGGGGSGDLIWEGWLDVETLCGRTGAARIDLTDEKGRSVRGYYLFRGDADLAAWDEGEAGPPFDSSWPIPAFVGSSELTVRETGSADHKM